MNWAEHIDSTAVSVSGGARMPTADRQILETIIFLGLYNNTSLHRILFVGTHLYSSWYSHIFLPRQDVIFFTVDPDILAAPYGAPGNHWICDLTLLTHVNYLANSFDVVIINGVFNYGINKLEDKKNALFTAQTLLKDEGVLLIGYRDKLPNRDFTPDMMEGLNFLPCAIPGLEREYVQSGSANGHAFSGYKKLGSVIAP